MFATLEEKLIVGALVVFTLMAVILTYNHHERSIGAQVCKTQDESAALTQQKKETRDAESIIESLHTQLSSISSSTPNAAPMRMCNNTSRPMPSRAATASSQPTKLPISSTGTSVQTGTESGSDYGPAVQDIALSCVLGITDANDLWNLAVKETHP